MYQGHVDPFPTHGLLQYFDPTTVFVYTYVIALDRYLLVFGLETFFRCAHVLSLQNRTGAFYALVASFSNPRCRLTHSSVGRNILPHIASVSSSHSLYNRPA